MDDTLIGVQAVEHFRDYDRDLDRVIAEQQMLRAQAEITESAEESQRVRKARRQAHKVSSWAGWAKHGDVSTLPFEFRVLWQMPTTYRDSLCHCAECTAMRERRMVPDWSWFSSLPKRPRDWAYLVSRARQSNQHVEGSAQ